MIGFFIALISGALMSVQGVFNTQVTKNSSIWVASAFVQFTALLVCRPHTPPEISAGGRCPD